MGVGGHIGGVGGWGGGCPTYMHMHAHAHTYTCTCMHGKHDNFMQMATPIGFGEILGIPYDVICTYMCMHACTCVCMCVGGILSPPHYHKPTCPPPGETPGISQNSIALELIEIFQILFEDLKSVETPPPIGGCIVW